MATEASAAVIRTSIGENLSVTQGLLAEETLLAVRRTAAAIAAAFHKRRKVLLFGNGGSAADAQHIAAELVGRFQLAGRPALPAIALASNPSIVTAIANDYDFKDVFSRQIEALGDPDDVAIAISTSGQSPNVLKGIQVSRELGLVTIALSGGDGGALRALVDHCLLAPSQNTARIQEAHILLGHIICELVERKLMASAS
jgi:D-sedoheptulose 7-phosphate isomerase